MTDPYIIKEAKPRWSKGKFTAVIGGSALAGALIIGGTAFGLQQINGPDPRGVSADQNDEFGSPGTHEDEGGFGEDRPERGEHEDRDFGGEEDEFEGEDSGRSGFSSGDIQAP